MHTSDLAEIDANCHSVMIFLVPTHAANRMKNMLKFFCCLAMQYFIHTNPHIHFNWVSDTELASFNRKS